MMNTKTCLALVLIACAVGESAANPEKVVLDTQMPVSSDTIGYIYYNTSTGEMIRVLPGQTRGVSQPIWINETYDQCGFGEWFYQPLRDSATGQDTWWMDWGGIERDSAIDTITVFYNTSISDPGQNGVPGFEMDISFFDGIDVRAISPTLLPYYVLTLPDLPGTAGTSSSWMITVDLSGGLEFEIGDMACIDYSCNGNNSGGLGADIDGNGLADFAYGFSFRHPSGGISGITGGVLVAPPEGVFPNGLDDEDLFLTFSTQDWGNPDGFGWFGGYDCFGGAGHNWTPWGSMFLGLYSDPDYICCVADYNNDTWFNIFDALAFLSDFYLRLPGADINCDGVWDFSDVTEFLDILFPCL